MAGVVRDWQLKLVGVYQDLFHPVGDPPSAQGWPTVGEGWRDLLRRTCVGIPAVQADGGTFRFAQIKETTELCARTGTARCRARLAPWLSRQSTPVAQTLHCCGARSDASH